MTWAYMEMMMPNSKQIDVKRKHKKLKNRIRNKRRDEIMNASKSSVNFLLAFGIDVPKELLNKFRH